MAIDDLKNFWREIAVGLAIAIIIGIGTAILVIGIDSKIVIAALSANQENLVKRVDKIAAALPGIAPLSARAARRFDKYS